MKSRASFCNATLLKKNITRFAPLWALYLAFWVLAAFFTAQSLMRFDVPNRAEEALNMTNQGLLITGVVVNAGYALLCAAALLKYLHASRSAYMMHAFPLNRSTQYGTNVITGLLFFLVPQLIFTVLLTVGLGVAGVSRALPLSLELLGKQCLAYLCFFGLAVFCMLLTGRTVIGVLSYGAINFIGFVLPALFCVILNNLFLGFSWSEDKLAELSPFLALSMNFTMTRGLIWAGVGIAALIAGWLHYRVRHLERAGDAMVHGWAQYAFQLLFTLTIGLGLAALLFEIFSGLEISRSPYLYLVCAALGLFLAWFGARMMLQRTVRVFGRKNWLGWGLCVLAMAALVLGLEYDVLGFQRKVPQQSRVESAEIVTATYHIVGSGGNRLSGVPIAVDDAATLSELLEGHQDMVNVCYADRFRPEDEWAETTMVQITYRLKNGFSQTRVYEMPMHGKLADTITALSRDPERAAAYYEAALPERIYSSDFYDHYYEDSASEAIFGPSFDGHIELYEQETDTLRQAILSDARAGRLPIMNNLTTTGTELGELYLMVEQRGVGFSIMLPDTATDTVAVLRSKLNK